MAKRKSTTRRRTNDRLGDDHFVHSFTARHYDPSGKQVQGDDGRLVHDWTESGTLMQETVYNGRYEVLNSKETLMITWVDIENKSYRTVFPNVVVKAIKRAFAKTAKDSRSARARKAYETRLQNGTVPQNFLPKGLRDMEEVK